MASRITRGAAAKEAAFLASDKENATPQLSSPPATPANPKSGARTKSALSKPKATKSAEASIGKTAKTQISTLIATERKHPAAAGSSRVKLEQDVGLGPVRSSPLSKEKAGKKRKRTVKHENEDGNEFVETPHNMGTVPEAEVELEDADTEDSTRTKQPNKKTSAKFQKSGTSAQSASKAAKDEQDADRSVIQLAKVKAKYAKEAEKRQKTMASGKKTRSETYGLMEGETPFPRWEHPTPAECQEVHDTLLKHHPDVHPQPQTIPPPSEFVAGCGEVRSILDALIRTRLSASTTGRNSNAAYQGMVKRYGLLKSGVGKGSVDYNAVRKTSVQDLFLAIKAGGLAVHKSADIKALLDIVYDENQARRNELLNAKNNQTSSGPKGAEIESDEQKEAEIKLAEDENLSLDHFYTLPTYDAIYKFMTFPGIGVKTAACVAMFCMQRPCFAVDTHVFRLSKWLGWVPPPEEKMKGDRPVDRDTTFSHLEVRVPDHLKYMLHQLFLRHGKTCPRCRGNTSESSESWSEGCVIDHLVQRSGPRKGGNSPAKATKAKVTKKMKKNIDSDEEDDDEEDEEMPDLNDDDDDDDDGDDYLESPVKTNKSTMNTPISSRNRGANSLASPANPVPAPSPQKITKATTRKRKTPPMNGWKGGKAVTSREGSTDG